MTGGGWGGEGGGAGQLSGLTFCPPQKIHAEVSSSFTEFQRIVFAQEGAPTDGDCENNDIIDDDGVSRTSSITEHVVPLIKMNIYHALINTLSAHMILINPNTKFYTQVEHSATKQFT